jgi:hypothetical protein
MFLMRKCFSYYPAWKIAPGRFAAMIFAACAVRVSIPAPGTYPDVNGPTLTVTEPLPFPQQQFPAETPPLDGGTKTDGKSDAILLSLPFDPIPH